MGFKVGNCKGKCISNDAFRYFDGLNLMYFASQKKNIHSFQVLSLGKLNQIMEIRMKLN